MAAYGSGAVARSIRDKATVMNVDIGGGTSKIAVCADGKVIDLTAVDVGARLVCLDDDRPDRAHRGSRRGGSPPSSASSSNSARRLSPEHARALAARMADRLFEAMRGGAPAVGGSGLCRLDPLSYRGTIDQVTFSGGVSEYIYGRETTSFGDLGMLLAQEIRDPRRKLGPDDRAVERGHPRDRGGRLAIHHAGERQHHLRVADGGAAAAQHAGDRADDAARRRGDRHRRRSRPRSRACCGGSISATATRRSRCSCRGAARRRSSGSMRSAKARSRACRTFWPRATRWCWRATATSAGLLGIHLHEEMKIDNGVVSIDGLELKDFDFIDIGTMLPASGAVPVVIKSLIFPTTAATGKEWQPAPRAVGEAAAGGLNKSQRHARACRRASTSCFFLRKTRRGWPGQARP